MRGRLVQPVRTDRAPVALAAPLVHQGSASGAARGTRTRVGILLGSEAHHHTAVRIARTSLMAHATPLRLALVLGAVLWIAPAAHALSGDIRIQGPITALGDGAVTVDSVWFAITPETEIRDADGLASFTDLALGQLVEVRGDSDAAGVLVAERIEILAPGPGHGVRLKGLVAERTDLALRVGAVWVTWTDATEILGSGTPGPDDLVVGTRVEVRGTLAAGSVLADRIEIEDGSEGEDVEAKGPIEALSDTSLTVARRTFQLTGQTTVVGDDGRATSAGALAVGRLVEVRGAVAPGGALVATRVEVEDFAEDEVELTGTIEALAADGLTVSGLSFAVSDATVVLDPDRRPIAFADLAVGLTVEIRADVDGAGVRRATHIHVEDVVEGEVELKSALDAVGEGFVVALGRAFTVDSSAVVVDRNGAPLGADALRPGDVAEVHATRLLSGDLVASRIELDDSPASVARLAAPVTAVGADTLWVIDVPFAVDGATHIVGLDGAQGALGDVLVGSSVEVDAAATASGWLATRIEVRRAARAAGRLTAPTAAGFTLGGLTVALDAGTSVVWPSGIRLGANPFASGQTVSVAGTTRPDGSLAAARVVVLAAASAVADEGAPTAAAVRVNAFPNPLADVATVRFTLAESAEVAVVVYDALGREVERLAEGPAPGGSHDVRLDAGALPSGVYVVRVLAPGRPPATTTLTVVR